MITNFEDLKRYYATNGFYYDDELLFNIQISLKTKPFLILSGISGTGKSKIIDLFSDFLVSSEDNSKNYALIPVRPNWIDNKNVFGYHNIIDDTYSITPIIKIFIDALNNQDKPYFIVLDEMNMAKVEHYFSDFLSILESRKEVVKSLEDFKDIKEIREFFTPARGGMGTSQAIILSAMDMNPEKSYQIQDFRDNRFSTLFGLVNGKIDGESKVITQNWMEQYRSEINQGVGRFANRCLNKIIKDEGHPDYQLKTLEEIEEKDKERFIAIQESYKTMSKLLDYYNITDESLKSSSGVWSYTDSNLITLHNHDTVLPISRIDEEIHGEVLDEIKKEKLGTDSLYNSRNLYNSELDTYFVPPTIPIPQNVYVVGTVNIDETTHTFSPKVLDRANVIEFNDVDIMRSIGIDTVVEEFKLSLSNNDINLGVNLANIDDSKWLYENDKECFEILLEVHKVLESKNMHFGYRVFNEVSSYIKNYTEYNSNQYIQALDNQILQKILPKLNGDIEEIEEVLQRILEITRLNTLKKSEVKLIRMIEDLELNGFTTFIK